MSQTNSYFDGPLELEIMDDIKELLTKNNIKFCNSSQSSVRSEIEFFNSSGTKCIIGVSWDSRASKESSSGSLLNFKGVYIVTSEFVRKIDLGNPKYLDIILQTIKKWLAR